GDHLVLSPRGVELRVRGIHAHNRPIERAAAGERCALNVAGNFPEGGEPRRGDWVVAAPLHAPTGRIDCRLTVSRAAPAALRDGLPVHVHLGTEDVVGRAAVLGARTIAPSDSGFVQLDLGHPVGALWGDRIVLRDHAARHTLAGGRVLDPMPPRRGRSRPERLAVLAAMTEPDAGDALEAALAEVQGAGKVVRDGAVLRLTEHQPRLSREDERLWGQVQPLLGADALRPLRVRELAAELSLQPELLTRFLKRVERFGRV